MVCILVNVTNIPNWKRCTFWVNQRWQHTLQPAMVLSKHNCVSTYSQNFWKRASSVLNLSMSLAHSCGCRDPSPYASLAEYSNFHSALSLRFASVRFSQYDSWSSRACQGIWNKYVGDWWYTSSYTAIAHSPTCGNTTKLLSHSIYIVHFPGKQEVVDSKSHW